MPESQDNIERNDIMQKAKRQVLYIWLVLVIISLGFLFLFDRMSPRMMLILEAKNPRTFSEQAAQYTREGNYEQAITAMQHAISILPADESFQVQLGDIYEQKGEFEKAVTAFQKAGENKPDDWKPWFRIGVVQRKMKQLPNAVQNLQKAEKLTQDERWVYNELGWAAYENHQYEIALNAFIQAARLEPNSSMYPLMQGTIFSQQGQWAQAKPCFDAAIALDSSKIELYKAAIDAAQKAGDKSAVAYYQSILPRK